MKNEKIIKLFRSGKPEKAFKKLYNYFPKVERFVVRYGGTQTEARDLFQDALLVTYEKLLNDNFSLSCTVETYVFSICKYKWKDQLNQKNKNVSFDSGKERMLNPESVDEVAYQRKLLKAETVLNALGEKCQKIFELFYYKGESMQSIADALGYSTVNAAKTQKYKCLERARKKLHTMDLSDEELLNQATGRSQLSLTNLNVSSGTN